MTKYSEDFIIIIITRIVSKKFSTTIGPVIRYSIYANTVIPMNA